MANQNNPIDREVADKKRVTWLKRNKKSWTDITATCYSDMIEHERDIHLAVAEKMKKVGLYSSKTSIGDIKLFTLFKKALEK